MNKKQVALGPSNNSNRERIGVFSLTMIGVAFAISLNLFSAGAAPNLSLKNTILSVFLAWIMLAGVWTLSGLMGQISGRGAADIFKIAFGGKGFKICSAIIVVCNSIWAIFDYWYVGSVMRNMMPNNPHLGFALGMAIITAAVIVGIIKEITSLKWLTALTVPFAVIMFIVIAATTISKSGGWEVIQNFKPPVSTPVVLAANTMFGCFCSLSVSFPDITRDCRSKKAILIAMPLSMLMVVIQCGLAQLGKIGLAAIDISSLALSLGGAVFYVTNIFVVFGQSNTCPTCSYMIISQANALAGIPKRVMTFVQPLFACAMAFVLEYVADITIINPWLSGIAAAFGPIIGALFAEFYVIHRAKLSEDELLPSFASAGIVNIIIGFVLCLYLTYVCPIATPVAVIGILFSFVLQIVLRKGFKLR